VGLVLKESNGDYFVLYEPAKIDALLAEVEGNNQVRFTYFLYTSNQYFLNFTDLPIENNSEILYLSNSKVNHSGSNVFLHTSEFVSKTDRFKLQQEVAIAGDGKEKLIELKDDDGEVIFKKKLRAEDRYMVINNTNVPIGKYHLYENGKLKNTFILFSNIPVYKPVAIVSISISGKTKEEFVEGVKELDVPLFDYKVSFSARNTYWKYFLISKYNNNLKNAVIDSGADNLKFKGPEEVKMKNGSDAVVFVSETPLPLKQIYDLRFQLKSVRNGISSGKTLMDKLPLASVEMIKPESREENSKVFSEIIVYI